MYVWTYACMHICMYVCVCMSGYFVLAVGVGLYVTGKLRRNEKTKHSLILGVKWVLRSAGAVHTYIHTYIDIYSVHTLHLYFDWRSLSYSHIVSILYIHTYILKHHIYVIYSYAPNTYCTYIRHTYIHTYIHNNRISTPTDLHLFKYTYIHTHAYIHT